MYRRAIKLFPCTQRRLLCKSRTLHRTDPGRFVEWMGKSTSEEKVVVPDLIISRPSLHHGKGVFACCDIPSGTVVGHAGKFFRNGETKGITGLSDQINDLTYSHCRRSFSDKSIDQMNYEDYQEMINEYCDIDSVPKFTNVIILNVKATQTLYIEAVRHIAKGEELSRFYSITFWLNHHLNHFIDKGDRSIYDPNHPLTKCILELKDPYSTNYFKSVRSHHGII